MLTDTATTTPEAWEGFRNGRLVATYTDRWAAERDLARRNVETISPKPEPKAVRLGAKRTGPEGLWLILPSRNLVALVLRHYPSFRYVNTWVDAQGFGVHLAHPTGWTGNRPAPKPRPQLDPARLP